MNLKKLIQEKKNNEGSYVVEAAVTLPIMIIALVSLISLILIVSICEDLCFNTILEAKDAAARAYSINESVSLCKKIEKNVQSSCDNLNNFEVVKGRYLYWDSNINAYDLIGLETKSCFKVENPIGISGKIDFGFNVAARAFTGSLQDCCGLGESGFYGGASEIVVIFPAYGERFHSQNCVYVRNTKDLNRTEIIQKEDAQRKGFSPCIICGGK